jgi:hypothetical protein
MEFQKTTTSYNGQFSFGSSFYCACFSLGVPNLKACVCVLCMSEHF